MDNNSTNTASVDADAETVAACITTGKRVPADVASRVSRRAEEARKHPAAHPEILVTSSEKGLGMDRLRAAVLEAALN